MECGQWEMQQNATTQETLPSPGQACHLAVEESIERIGFIIRVGRNAMIVLSCLVLGVEKEVH